MRNVPYMRVCLCTDHTGREDFLGILGVRWVFRKSGAFFIKRSFADNELYTTIFNEYMALLLGTCDS